VVSMVNVKINNILTRSGGEHGECKDKQYINKIWW
jgi:hypothetical protein